MSCICEIEKESKKRKYYEILARLQAARGKQLCRKCEKYAREDDEYTAHLQIYGYEKPESWWGLPTILIGILVTVFVLTEIVYRILLFLGNYIRIS